ncbi:restriction endonuclease [Burkholderia pseudomallei]|uniref:restriction endonuclease n=2 Tax=Burkholderia pseudomallei TaxID=28450 RepID=UPI00039EDE47|nr:restriction endonuclease [Burkholderia pseudomallei]AIP59368.1 restriction endonuclease family protein [Burkholderia pseudomallei HBPUB10303a]KIX58309.1 restriction endonuclease [Burkholderia pseudomallei]MBF3436985.1 restriction endonuclease [Burkholderia pseudomallei]MBF3453774.1 restriction endonuclease [Burkholderia pseudomallei]MBF3476438.1 restriction endonuclease [Burkholderia pseudomallei]
MPIPDYQTLMLPVLRAVADGQEHRFRNVVETLADEYQLTDEERNTLLPSGTAPLFDNRVGWARTYLKQAGVVESKKRGYFNITERGNALLAQNPHRIDNRTLDQYPEFATFRQKKTDYAQATVTPVSQPGVSAPEIDGSTPEESFAQAYQRLRANLEAELLDQVKSSTPSFFERLVIDLLVAMGYGGSRQDAGSVIGRSGDGGIDGTIKEDKLGLDVIYVQAKKWEGTVGRPEIQKFAGALQGQRANKGVFITTSAFTREAKEYAGVIASKIILVDGDELVKLMVDHNVGVSTVSTFHVKKVDSDYFEGDAL